MEYKCKDYKKKGDGLNELADLGAIIRSCDYIHSSDPERERYAGYKTKKDMSKVLPEDKGESSY